MLQENATLEEVANALRQLSQHNAMKFMLITEEVKSNVKFQYSSHFNHEQIEDIKDVLNKATITTIKPTLSQMHPLKLLKNQHPTALIKQYRDLFNSLSQVVCKEVAKAWIKIIEPYKQALYPYRDFNMTKPSWWPQHVNHIEPDHLDKFGRVEVLINVLRHPQFDLKEVDLRLYNKRPVIQSFMREILYLAIHDRLFYNLQRDEDDLFQFIEEEDRELFRGSRLVLMASDLKMRGTQELIMSSKVKEEHLNHEVFSLNQTCDSEADSSRNWAPNKCGKIVKTKSKSNLRAIAKEKKPVTRSGAKLGQLVLKDVQRDLSSKEGSSSPGTGDASMKSRPTPNSIRKVKSTRILKSGVNHGTHVQQDIANSQSDSDESMESFLEDECLAASGPIHAVKVETARPIQEDSMENVFAEFDRHQARKKEVEEKEALRESSDESDLTEYNEDEQVPQHSSVSSNDDEANTTVTASFPGAMHYYDEFESSDEEDPSAFDASSSSDDLFENLQKIYRDEVATFDDFNSGTSALHL